VLSRELGFGRTKSEGLGSSSGRSRCLPILERFASEGAERVAGNKMALNVERVMDDGVRGVFVYIDKHYEVAKTAGAKIAHPPKDQPYGRTY
jgi:uncharacterized glyoxalase superfamily protein PhnB